MSSEEIISTLICRNCNNEYDKSYFLRFDKYNEITCKICYNERAKQYRERNKKKKIDINFDDTKKCIQCGEIKKLSEFNRDNHIIRNLCRQCRAKKDRLRKNNMTDEQKDEKNRKRREYSKLKPEKHREQNKRYKAKNKDKISIAQRRYRNENPDYEISLKCRNAIRKCFRGQHTIAGPEILGCNREFFIKWITYQFNENMTIENYATYWNFDHVIPIYLYDLTNVKSIINCFHWSNTRCIKKQENQIKNKYLTSDDIINHNKIITKFCLENNIDVNTHLLSVQFGNQINIYSETPQLQEPPKASTTSS